MDSVYTNDRESEMKHFFNRKENIVTDALDGFLLTSPKGALARLDTYPDIKVILRADWDKSKVAIISGGGAGHEPSHTGFVGKGMLTAAVSGEIFASPSVDALLTAIRHVTGDAGCLLIVKNYTGDRLNFGLAAEKARAEGFKVEMVIVADDIALPELHQPRGVAGTLFIHKIAGYLSENNESLDLITKATNSAAGNLASFGIALSSCSIPGQDHQERLGANEAELGLGIHGEPGVERLTMRGADQLVSIMVERLLNALPVKGDYALLINNLGAVPPLEMSLISNAVLSSPLGDHVELIIGPAALMTALNMNGFSLSMMLLNSVRKQALLAPVAPHAWIPVVERHKIMVQPATKNAQSRKQIPASHDPEVEQIISTVCKHLISLEPVLNQLDARVGDGDTGSTVATGAGSILSQLATLPQKNAEATLEAIGSILGKSMGGSSGVLLSIFFTAASKSMATKENIAHALLDGLGRMTFYGGAKLGDRTMVDALDPALRAFAKGGIADAAQAARAGAALTKNMTKAKAGRASYIAASDLKDIADPGAVAIAEAFETVARVMKQYQSNG
jgi:triose/dihydroxyacetone kinase / FAD-AMP lyase (cyclizing)